MPKKEDDSVEFLNHYVTNELTTICKILDIPYLTPPQAQPIAHFIVNNKAAYKNLNMKDFLSKTSLELVLRKIKRIKK